MVFLEDELELDKHLHIKPSPPVKSAPHQDDTHSPAHDAEAVGSGVRDDDGYDAIADTSVADESTDAPEDVAAPGEPGKVEATKETP